MGAVVEVVPVRTTGVPTLQAAPSSASVVTAVAIGAVASGFAASSGLNRAKIGQLRQV